MTTLWAASIAARHGQSVRHYAMAFDADTEQEARETYARRFGCEANLLVLPVADVCAVDGCDVVGREAIARGSVWAGRVEGGA